MSDYKVFKIRCNTALRELLIAELVEIGFEGFLENEDGFEAYLEQEAYNVNDFSAIMLQYGINQSEYEEKSIAQQNWNANWESSFEPVFIDNKVVIRAPFHVIEKQYPFEVIIQPKTSFGTGHHETTQSIMELMLEVDFEDKSVFDYGCGTGVLSILASKKGAAYIFANDIDDWAFENIGENAGYNNITNINYAKGDLSVVPNKEFDIILANINKNILLRNVHVKKLLL